MNAPQIVLGSPFEPFDAALERMAALPAWQPFDARAVAFVTRFSQRLLTDPAVRAYPELAALAHWFRGARLRELAARHPVRDGDTILLGRGLAFHLAPANVDSVFMYSWLLSLLAGNANLVRLSQKASPQVDFLISVLRSTLEEDAGHPVDGRFLLLTYPHDEALTRTISLSAMVRVVWGGDASVAAVRAIPLRPTAVEMVFPDRFSAAAFNSAAVARLSQEELSRLVGAFYNDTFWFAQQACSSPRILAFVGPPMATRAARERFWPAFDEEVQRRRPENDGAMTMARLTATFEYAAAAIATPTGEFIPGRHPQRLALEAPLDARTRALHCGHGLFLEHAVADLTQLARQLTDKDQTLAVFGFARQDLEDMALQLPPRALDRIVAVGDALTFDTVWDGQDLLAGFSRRIRLPAA